MSGWLGQSRILNSSLPLPLLLPLPLPQPPAPTSLPLPLALNSALALSVSLNLAQPLAFTLHLSPLALCLPAHRHEQRRHLRLAQSAQLGPGRAYRREQRTPPQ